MEYLLWVVAFAILQVKTNPESLLYRDVENFFADPLFLDAALDIASKFLVETQGGPGGRVKIKLNVAPEENKFDFWNYLNNLNFFF